LQVKDGAFWKWLRGIYERASEVDLDEAAIRKFVAECPPFHALVLGICAAQYERCIRDLQRTNVSYRAGAVDLFSAVYLPYSAEFITADERQFNALTEVARMAQLENKVVLYQDFKKQLLLLV